MSEEEHKEILEAQLKSLVFQAKQQIKKELYASITCQLQKIAGFHTIDECPNPWERDLCMNVILIIKQAMTDCGIKEV